MDTNQVECSESTVVSRRPGFIPCKYIQLVYSFLGKTNALEICARVAHRQ